MRSISEQVVSRLGQYVSPLNASALVKRAHEQTGIVGEPRSAADRLRLMSAIETSLGFFIAEPHARTRALVDIRALLALDPLETPKAERFDVRTEDDVSVVRSAGRRIAETIGANGFSSQKVTTIVSELARNIVSYTSGGEIRLAAARTPKAMVSIAARDDGKGIPNLDEILRGAYRSRTGLGRGILGCKRLADRFEIDSSASGTRIEVDVIV